MKFLTKIKNEKFVVFSAEILLFALVDRPDYINLYNELVWNQKHSRNYNLPDLANEKYCLWRKQIIKK